MQPHVQWVLRILSLGVKQPGTLKLTSYLDLVLRLRMSGARPLYPQYVFITCSGTALLITVLIQQMCKVDSFSVSNYRNVKGKVHPITCHEG